MATTLPQPSDTSGSPAGLPPDRDAFGSARKALAARESPRRRVARLLLLVLAIVVLAKGWAVTDIDLGKLANAPNAVPILKALLQPDVASRDITQIELQVPIVVGGSSEEPTVAQ